MGQNTLNNPANNYTNQNSGVVILKNQLKSESYLSLTLTSDGTGNQNNANILLFPGLTPGNSQVAGYVPDGTHITLSSPKLSGTVSEVYQYLLTVKMHCTKMTVTTSDTANFGSNNFITLGSVDADGRVTRVHDVYFNNYKVQNGTTVNDTLVIDDIDFTTGGNFFLRLNALKLSTNINFLFDIAGTNDNAVITPRN